MTSIRRAVGTVAATALVVGSTLLGSTPARAEEGLRVTATSRYVVDAEDEVVRASMTMRLRNVSPDRAEGNGVFAYYYDAYAVPIPRSAREVRARSGDTDLAVSVDATDDPSTALARISFPELTYDTERTIVLSFDIAGEPPRSEDQTRLGPGYATFVAYGPGDPGRNVVDVVGPRGWAFTATTDGFDGGTDEPDGAVTYRATENTFEGGLWSVVSLRDVRQVSERTVDVGDLSLVLESFPDDETWSGFVAERLTEGLPVLQRLVDNPWPGGLQRIREDAAPSLRGYDGWFDPSGDEIVVGEQLDADLIYHELSHAWLSGERFDERWVYEGLAQAVAERTVERTGGQPADPTTVSRSGPDALPLNAWDGDAGARSGDVDGYAYPASFRVMRELLGDLDDESFAAVVGAGIRGERAYDPPGTVTPSAGRTAWTDWLDLVETRAGVEEAPEVFSRWVLTSEQRAQLEPRARERDGYEAVDDGDRTWLPPEGLRDALTSWDFDRARSIRAAVAPLGASVRAVQDASERTGLAVPPTVRTSYERASVEDDYAALRTTLPETARALTSVDAARRVAAEDPDPVTSLGRALLDVDEHAARAVALLEDGRIAPAQRAADDVAERAGRAGLLGAGLVTLAVLVLAAIVLLVTLTLRRRRSAGTGRHVGSRAPATPPPPGRDAPEAVTADGIGSDQGRGSSPSPVPVDPRG